MSLYAANTAVTSDRTRAEIERTLRRYGADDIVVGTSAAKREAFVQFHYRELNLELRIHLPDLASREFQRTASGKRRRDSVSGFREWEKACRQKWRVLLLLLKAQLEAVQNAIWQPWEAFLPWVRMADGRTIAQAVNGNVGKLLAESAACRMLGFTEPAAESQDLRKESRL